jgi:hypothetical protein
MRDAHGKRPVEWHAGEEAKKAVTCLESFKAFYGFWLVWLIGDSISATAQISSV